MRRLLPYSLAFFVATLCVFFLQLIPIIGIFLMFMLAMAWSIFLVNAGMIGVAFEAALGQVSRWWLILPVAFYGTYWYVATVERVTLQRVSASQEEFNAGVTAGFDPSRNALVLDYEEDAAWLTQNYALPVAYEANKNLPEGFLSHRMVDSSVCTKVRESPAMGAAGVDTWVLSDDISHRWGSKERFCDLRMPEKPELPVVRVSHQREQTYSGTLPVIQTTTTIITPDGSSVRLLSGAATPLSWFPRPILGCGLNSAAPKWECFAQFWREDLTPILPGDAGHNLDSVLLARALRLKPIAISDRQGSDPALVLQNATAVEDAALARQLVNLDKILADPSVHADWRTDVIRNHPDILASYADKIVDGLERAAMVPDNERYRTRDNGRTLAGLLAKLPQEKFAGVGPRALALYAKADAKHWLWETDTLKRRLRDLVPGATPVLDEPRK